MFRDRKEAGLGIFYRGERDIFGSAASQDRLPADERKKRIRESLEKLA